jgi:hypothetical protein
MAAAILMPARPPRSWQMLRSPYAGRVIQGAGAKPPNTCTYLLRALFL